MTISRAYALEHFDEICERAENGEEIMLERPGKAGLTLVRRPAVEHTAEQRKRAEQAADSIRRHMDSQPRYEGKIDYRALINEGRRF